jgi:hypothetical protein
MTNILTNLNNNQNLKEKNPPEWWPWLRLSFPGAFSIKNLRSYKNKRETNLKIFNWTSFFQKFAISQSFFIMHKVHLKIAIYAIAAFKSLTYN